MSAANVVGKGLAVLCSDWYRLLGGFLFVYFSVQAIYNAFFHPLAKYPGPALAKISMLPSFYHAVKGDRHVWSWQCHHIYGDTVRIEPNTVVFADPRAYRAIYAAKANVKRCKLYEAFVRKGHVHSTFNVTDPALHAQKRKMLNQAFTDKAVGHAAVFVTQHVDRWLDILVQEREAEAEGAVWTRPLNMATWTEWLVFDIMGDLCFGRSWETKEPGPNPFRHIPSRIVKKARFFYPITRSPLIDFLIWAKPFLGVLRNAFEKILPQPVQQYHQFVHASVSQRIQQERDHAAAKHGKRDMFHFLYHATHPETGAPAYTHEQLRAEANLLIFAGSDSITTAICGFWFYMSRNAAVYAKLTTEIRSTFSTSADIVSGYKLASCRYLHACLDETLRMAVPGPTELGREVLVGGASINGAYFPAGVVVGCANWSMSRNEQVFGDANRFRPERYMVSEGAGGVTAEEVNRLKASFHPFSMGPSSCAGKSIAMTEFALIVARTLFRLDLRAAPGNTLGAGHPSLGWGRRDPKQYQLIDAYISVKDGPVLQFRERADQQF
ncbi:benzoate 4-monooxygenase cytochrome P450 [Massariosphaeria phaeospora]|uniref:Benzoate 4-monooxygenase cytochrome P450 n=1 Tax=Massariosphaeria phaeospora TaxID=100035 RepID=A0A7C8I1N7_9PLEO|nr:benzoate 4-monooxygenase cytochrome P450 [Massariosphaeria phaeospora]